MDKVFVAQNVANKLFATEKAVDAAIMETATLLTTLMQARQDVGVSAITGDATSAKIAQAIAQLHEARSTITMAHQELDEVRLRVGIRTKLIGVVDKPFASADPLTRAA